MSVSDKEGFRKLGKVVVDVNLEGGVKNNNIGLGQSFAPNKPRIDGGNRKTYILETTTIGRQSLVQRNGVTLVVLPVGDTRRDHPVLLFLSGRLSRRTSEDRRRRRRGTSGDLFGFETGRLERVFDDLGHLDNSLVGIGGPLLSRSISDVGGVSLRVGNLYREGQVK